MNKLFTSFLGRTALLGLFLAIFFAQPIQAQAQPIVKYIVVANGGQFGNPLEDVNLLLYDPVSGTQTVLDTVHTNSVQDLLIEQNFAYVAAQDSIVKFDLATGEKLVTAPFGVQTLFGAGSTIKLGLYEDYLIVGNWFGSSDNNLRIFEKETLAFVDSIPDLLYGATDFVIVDDSAYVIQNMTSSSYSDSAGYMAVIDLDNMEFHRNVIINTNGEDLGRLVYQDGLIYGLNSQTNSLTTFDPALGTGSTAPSAVDFTINGYGPQTGFLNGTFYTKINNKLASFDLSNNQIIDSSVVDTVITAFAVDTVNDLFYVTQTDFYSYTQGRIYQEDGTPAGSFPTGFAPEAISVAYNHVPVANTDTFVIFNNGIMQELFHLFNDEDKDEDSLSYEILTPPNFGTVVMAPEYISITTDQFYVGPDSIEYVVSDVWGDKDTAWIYLDIILFLSIDDNQLFELNTYPNPVNEFLFIQNKTNQTVDFEILDMKGSLMLESFALPGESKELTAFKEFADGVYFIRTEQGSQSFIVRH